jgi:protein TonB
MEEEAVRVLKKTTKWEPAIQNGIKVKAYRKQLMMFEVLEG